MLKTNITNNFSYTFLSIKQKNVQFANQVSVGVETLHLLGRIVVLDILNYDIYVISFNKKMLTKLWYI